MQNVPQWLSDTWEWDGATWTQHDGKGPPSRFGHGMAFDTIRARTVLFGGTALNYSRFLGDTWEWNGATWVLMSEFGPVPRTATSLCFDGSETVLFGGQIRVNENFTPIGDTWSFDGRFGRSPRTLDQGQERLV